MPVRDQLEQTKAGFIAKVPGEAQADIFRHIKEQQLSGAVFGLHEGDKAPDFTLPNPLGEQVTLYDELAKGPVVFIFYRGGWCPFCNVQLRAYQQCLPEIRKQGAQLLAVSPQSPDNSLSQKEKEKLIFQVLSDTNGLVAESYNLLFELPDYLQHTLKHTLGLDLGVYNRTDRWVLPVPAALIIDQAGFVRFAEADPDFMKRTEPQTIIGELKKL
ncbi:peroxiredoxin-like family protein [Paenibacillus thalictri]|uniref:thioredoxin-dependent peroxiredoxin n=1 Tax=Paenibacillus thalictri TaxID=2527873 RepID=A0A4V2J3P3_9BACL|nr:peroxiredoxin-like family protein [Paenibacillus thalictri]TBL74592.1 AhpC/TSA family protein [Paenibacillus thalictri]